MIINKMKKTAYKNVFANFYFRHTYNQKEINLIEESGGKLMVMNSN